jgi:hypothetical protein
MIHGRGVGGEKRALSLVGIKWYVFHEHLAFFSSFNVNYGTVYVRSLSSSRRKTQKDARSEHFRHMPCNVLSCSPVEIYGRQGDAVPPVYSFVLCPQDGEGMFFRNVSRFLPHYTAAHPRKRQGSFMVDSQNFRHNRRYSRGIATQLSYI